MCYRVSTIDEETGVEYVHYDHLAEYNQYLTHSISSKFYHRYSANGFEPVRFPVITTEGKLEFMVWDFVPPWIKDEKGKNEVLRKMNMRNVRSDTIFEKKSYRSAIHEKRGILLADGMYEWHQRTKKDKYPFYVYLKDRKLFSMGVLWSEWVNNETGEINKGFSLVTTDANPTMALIHNDGERMPLVLQKEHEGAWLNLSISDSEIKEIMQTYPDTQMGYHTVSKKLLLTPGINVPEVIAPFHYPELTTLKPVQQAQQQSLF
jgi:putative SOS response-associated peptidase YedK